VVDRLSDHFTVITYDRRGLSRSTVVNPSAPAGIATHVDDAHRLLEAVAGEPARVVGFSMGALLGLELAARHPEQVRTLVAHEAPLPEFLPDGARERARAEQVGVEETFKREGVVGAMRALMALAATDFGDRETDVELPRPTGEPAAQHAANMAYFLTNDAPAVHRHRLDVGGLERVVKAGRVRIVAGAGVSDRGRWIHQCAEGLAARLGVELAELPGGHNGFVTHPRAFAARLVELLR
jgi:pimeloyl-ACP methyl ester carboxylesterase